MPQSKTLSQNRKAFYTQFPKDIHSSLHEDSRLQWDALYTIRDRIADVAEITLTNNANLDFDMNAGQSLLLILKQDTVGGHTPTFGKAPDGSKKWLGLNTVTWDTTANTYTALVFNAVDPQTVYLLTSLTGGDLS